MKFQTLFFAFLSVSATYTPLEFEKRVPSRTHRPALVALAFVSTALLATILHPQLPLLARSSSEGIRHESCIGCESLKTGKGVIPIGNLSFLSIYQTGFVGPDWFITYTQDAFASYSFELKSDTPDLEDQVFFNLAYNASAVEIWVDSPNYYPGPRGIRYTLVVNISLPVDLVLDFDARIFSNDLVVTNPAKYNHLSINAASGDINIDSASCKTANLTVASGDIGILSLKASDSVSLHAASGDINIKTMESPNVEITAFSGNIKAKIEKYKRLKATSFSGNTHLDLGPLPSSINNFGVFSGDINASFTGFEGKFSGFTSVKGPLVELDPKNKKSGTVGHGDGIANCGSFSGACSAQFA